MSALQQEKTAELLKRQIEAVLFIATDGASVQELASATGHTTAAVRKILNALRDDFSKSHGMEVVELGGKWFMTSAEDMSDTLERVQLLNMQHFSDQFEGRTVLAYGRIAGPGEIQDPYYDGSWTQKFSSDDELPPIGTVVILRGTWRGGVIEDCAIVPTQEY